MQFYTTPASCRGLRRRIECVLFIIPHCIYSKQGPFQNPKLSILSSLAAQQHLAILLSPVAPVLNIGVEVMHRALLGIQTHISCVRSQPSYPQSRLSSSYSTFLLAFECALSYEVRYGIFPLEHHDSLNKFPAFGHLGFCILGLGMLILCQ